MSGSRRPPEPAKGPSKRPHEPTLAPTAKAAPRPHEPTLPPIAKAAPAGKAKPQDPPQDPCDAADGFLNMFAGKSFDDVVQEKKGATQMDLLHDHLMLQHFAELEAADDSDLESNPMSMDEQLALEEERNELLAKREMLEEEKKATEIQAQLNKLASQNLQAERQKLEEERVVQKMKAEMREKSFEMAKEKEAKRLKAEAANLEDDKKTFDLMKKEVESELTDRSDQLEADRQHLQKQANKSSDSKAGRFFHNGMPMQKPVSFSGSQRAWERKNSDFA